MRRNLLVVAFVLGGALFLWAQRSPAYLPYEVKAVFPTEVSPGRYTQIEQRDLDALARQGWALVSVIPYVYLNEERGSKTTLRPIVTQTYPAYYFQRAANVLK